MGHEVKPDPENLRWYCDVDISHFPESYTPFIRLALARYQPNAALGLELSPVVQLDYMQLFPYRAATVFRMSDTTVLVGVEGTTYDGGRFKGGTSGTVPQGSVIEAQVEQRRDDMEFTDELFGWIPVPGVAPVELDFSVRIPRPAQTGWPAEIAIPGRADAGASRFASTSSSAPRSKASISAGSSTRRRSVCLRPTPRRWRALGDNTSGYGGDRPGGAADVRLAGRGRLQSADAAGECELAGGPGERVQRPALDVLEREVSDIRLHGERSDHRRLERRRGRVRPRPEEGQDDKSQRRPEARRGKRSEFRADAFGQRSPCGFRFQRYEPGEEGQERSGGRLRPRPQAEEDATDLAGQARRRAELRLLPSGDLRQRTVCRVLVVRDQPRAAGTETKAPTSFSAT